MNIDIDQNRSQSIIIVDDTPANLELLSGALKECGYRVRPASSGKLALQAAQNDPPDLILLDIMMPEMDGYEVCRHLKENEITKDIPVIFITSMDKDNDEEKGLLLGAVDYITKPIRVPIVNARVHTHLQLKLHRDHLKEMVAQKTAELEATNQDLLKEISERKLAEEVIKKSLVEKQTLLMEIHHRVKNNLQIISSILNLQTAYVKDDQMLDLLVVIQNRIRSMAYIHELLYHSKDYSGVNFREYLENLLVNLFLTHGINSKLIKYTISPEHMFIKINLAIPCGLIVNELVTNSLKYAFPNGTSGEVCISLTSSDGKYFLIVKDNGIGLPQDVDPAANTALGLRLVQIMIKQVNGNLEIIRENGTEFRIVFNE